MKFTIALVASLMCVTNAVGLREKKGVNLDELIMLVDEQSEQADRSLGWFDRWFGDDDEDEDDGDMSIVDIANSTELFSTLVTALELADLVDLLDGSAGGRHWWKRYFTVFAPTNDAFSALGETLTTLTTNPNFLPHLRGILKYHVASGRRIRFDDLFDNQIIFTLSGFEPIEVSIEDGVVKVDDATITSEEEIDADNGVIHVIDSVLIPPFMERTIVDVVADTFEDFFETLVKAVAAAGLVDTLNSAGDFTLFAPTDRAFDKLPDGTIDDLIENDIQTLTNILLYHVIPGTVIVRDDIDDDVTIETALAGNTTEVTVNTRRRGWFRRGKRGVSLNDDSKVILFDILANNGVVHVIDEVLIPPYLG